MATDIDAHTPGRPVVAILHTGARGVFRRQIEEFKDSLEDAGLEINEDVEVDDAYWNEDGTPAELATLAKKLFDDIPAADLKVVIAAGGPASALAARTARGARTTPIVFTTILDPVRAGLLTNLQAPDTHITGMAGLTTELDVERLRLLLDLLQGQVNVQKVGVLLRTGRVDRDNWLAKVRAAATRWGLTLNEKEADNEQQIRAAFTSFRTDCQAVLVTADPLFNSKRRLVVKQANDKANNFQRFLPAIYQWREFVSVGGLMSYGPTMSEAYRHAALYAAYIVGDGKTPAQLPVVYPTQFELAINTKTAGRRNPPLTIPPEMRARAVLFPRGR
jgi:putative ABC transport system substrate-binding protein